MLCFRYKRLLIPYSEGELDERARHKLEAHLHACERCNSDLRAIRSVSGAFAAAGAPAVEPANDLWARVSERIAAESPRPAPKPWFKTPQTISAAATAMVVVAFGFVLIRSDLLTQPRLVQPSASTTIKEEHADRRAAAGSPKIAKANDGWKSTLTEKPGEIVVAKLPETSLHTNAGAYVPDVDRRTRGGAVDSRLRAPAPAPPSDTKTEFKFADEFSEEASAAKHDDHFYRDSVAALPATPAAAPSAAVSGPAPGLDAGADDAGVAGAESDGSTRYFYAATADSDGLRVTDESVVDTLSETEGVRTAALFTYP